MKKRSRFLTLFYMVLSCVLCSIAVNWVALPNGFVVTGLTGLSMTAASFVGINYALIFYGLTLLMLLCTFLTLGYKEVSNIIFLSVLYPWCCGCSTMCRWRSFCRRSSSPSCSSA